MKNPTVAEQSVSEVVCVMHGKVKALSNFFILFYKQTEFVFYVPEI